MPGQNSNRFPPPRKSPTGTVIKIYSVALLVALIFFLRGYYKTSYAIDFGVWLALIAWLKFRRHE